MTISVLLTASMSIMSVSNWCQSVTMISVWSLAIFLNNVSTKWWKCQDNSSAKCCQSALTMSIKAMLCSVLPTGAYFGKHTHPHYNQTSPSQNAAQAMHCLTQSRLLAAPLLLVSVSPSHNSVRVIVTQQCQCHTTVSLSHNCLCHCHTTVSVSHKCHCHTTVSLCHNSVTMTLTLLCDTTVSVIVTQYSP